MLAPWWVIAVVSFFVGAIIKMHGFKSFVCGFTGIFLLWFITAFIIDYKTDSILTVKIAAVFGLSSSFLIILITAIIGGIVGGFATLSGSTFRKLL
jgi:uncharacterized membrane protein